MVFPFLAAVLNVHKGVYKNYTKGKKTDNLVEVVYESPLIFFSQAQADATASSRLRLVFHPKTSLAFVVSA
jgi:hypothetical protein